MIRVPRRGCAVAPGNRAERKATNFEGESATPSVGIVLRWGAAYSPQVFSSEAASRLFLWKEFDNPKPNGIMTHH